MITTELKKRVITVLQERRALFSGSDAKFAVFLGINTAQYSRIKNGETERVLSDAVWISLARQCNVQVGNSLLWNTAKTPVFEFITSQLAFCQQKSASRLLCDIADIGKTHTAKHYATSNKNAVYVDCSQYKSKQRLVKHIAKEFGVGYTGKYLDVYADLVFYLRQLDNPLIILDEAGDLDYGAFLELKALWNATEGFCGWYMMGADGLRKKIDTRIEYRKVGYTEIFSRYGNRYQKASPDGNEDLKQFKMIQSGLIIRANFPADVDVNKTIAQADFTLRNLKEVRKKISA
ncbi:ATP-binding protein [Solitalea koreensis]|uniref:ORC1/DEAH AAA+ ATPase domain-containing protein n=1 Tax=Solitalea koreensis TaxID=543615 RepID=A0A521BMS3_9SPHI|nr:ATP-binding protein [Solitalea koreensis]SMO48438.1 hypothetical protein SAMN06265350_102348 [Solitalea koreensis]